MKKELRWRVIYGYNSNDYISITEDFLEKAKYAWIAKKIFNAPNGKMINGNEIKRIEPDFRFYTGWFDSYNPQTAEDYAQIDRDVPQKELSERSLLADNRVKYVLHNNKINLLSDVNSIDKLLLQ